MRLSATIFIRPDMHTHLLQLLYAILEVHRSLLFKKTQTRNLTRSKFLKIITLKEEMTSCNVYCVKIFYVIYIKNRPF